MASLKGTKTEENLLKAFAGESQARTGPVHLEVVDLCAVQRRANRSIATRESPSLLTASVAAHAVGASRWLRSRV